MSRRPVSSHRGRRGRADLLECLEACGEDALRHAALTLGFDPPAEGMTASLQDEIPPPSAEFDLTKRTSVSQAKPTSASRLRFWRVVEQRDVATGATAERPPWARRLGRLGRADAERPQAPPSPPVPLSPWSRLWPFLYRVLGNPRPGGGPDLERLVDAIARGHDLRRLPRRHRHGWAPRAQVLIERATRLGPFRKDFDRLCRGLARLRGCRGLDLLVFEQGPSGECRRWADPLNRPPERYRPPPPGSVLLVLSDLGCLQPPDDLGLREGAVAGWLKFGRDLAAAGLVPVVLGPVPRRHWRSSLGRWFVPVPWDFGRALPRRLSPVTGGGAQENDRATVERLLTLLSPAVSIDPDLLRAVRRLLPSGEDAPPADAAVESAVWMHPHVRVGPRRLTLDAGFQAGLRARFADEDLALQQRVLALIRLHHRNRSVAVRLEEELVGLQATGAEPPAGEGGQEFVRRLLGTVLEQPGFADLASLQAWLRRIARRAPAGLLAYAPALEAAWVKVHQRALLAGQVVVPESVSLTRASWVLGDLESRSALLYQVGLELEVVDTEASLIGVAPVARIEFGMPRVEVLRDGERGQPLTLAVGIRIAPPRQGQSLSLVSDRQRLELDTIGRPDHAASMGRDRHGLFVVDQSGQRHELGLLEHAMSKPDWADEVGEDDYGRWAKVRIEGTAFYLRWVPPGEFWMGSPTDEPGRDDDETRHRVTLSQGFWLAETPVTQVLWRAVMGDNPSRFKGSGLPVDSVSWDDCQRFIDQLNQSRPGLELRLPSEAEWEYACRAGTGTAYAFGDAINPEQANYGRNVGSTVEVKSLPCNAWGLYQMHGNVWEWCADRFGAYPAGPARDPAGPTSGADRVLRGGSWDFIAGWARSAFRGRRRPGYANVFTGLRLARGPGQAESEPARTGGVGAEPVRAGGGR